MTITEKELAEKLEHASETDLADEIGEPDWAAVAFKAAELLGVELAPEKPAPGLYKADDGCVILVNDEGGQSLIEPETGYSLILRELGMYSADRLTPVRVVPAAPIELSEEDLDAAYPHDEPSAYGAFDAFSKYDRRALLRMCQNLIAKHGHGRAEVTREQVRSAISRGLARTGGYTYARAEDATDAVMDLLGGANRG